MTVDVREQKDMSEIELLSRARNGEARAAEELFTKYLKGSRSVQGLLRKAFLHPEDREDLMHEIFLQLVSGKNSFRGEARLSTYVYQVARMTAFQKYRRENTLKRGKGFRRISESIDLEDGPRSNPEYTCSAKQTESTIIELIDTLPTPYRRVLNLRVEGLPYEEIAKELNLPVNTVSTKIHKARKILASKIRGLFPAGSGFLKQISPWLSPSTPL